MNFKVLLEKKNAELLDVCKNFVSDVDASSNVEALSDLLNKYLESPDFKPEHIRDMTYRTTKLITFLTHLGGIIAKANYYEQVSNARKELESHE